MLEYVGKLTKDPTRVSPQDHQRLRSVGCADRGHSSAGEATFMEAAQSIRIPMPLVFGLGLAALVPSRALANADDPNSPANPEEEARQVVARALEESWPARPEWVDMLAEILQGSQLGPDDGWF